MTVKEAHDIVNQLQEFEFPYALSKARKLALLKAGGIPSMSKLFAVTGQNNRRHAGKRAVDTEILLREVQSKSRDSDRYATAVARMNYLHARYRRANKITDPDLLHTLGDGLAEFLNVVDRDEWRKLTDVEKCAAGVFHKHLGEDMDIPFDPLPSSSEGWTDGLHFAMELADWTIRYEKEVAKPTATNDDYVRVYVDSAVSSMPGFVRAALRKSLGADLDDVMRSSLW
ncbi:mycophenolic acid synthesis protein B [Colletotrichum liriopes]|uniref:Mycophenolic acid synthesis protein B n=1 Tax=Colletotrichum liriopes TaxID=708192 RepID=A0AA37LVU8_9PEZI|nr:mycophenolic acid synthesis protein B [Colletotrichum liriopes]